MSSLLAKAFLWMLTAYLLIGVVSLLFPSSNQPEVIYQKYTIFYKLNFLFGIGD